MQGGPESAASPEIHVLAEVDNQIAFFRFWARNRLPDPLFMSCDVVDSLKYKHKYMYVFG